VIHPTRRRTIAALGLGLTATLTVAACGSGSSGSTTPSAGGSASFDPSSVTKNDTIAAMVPASVSQDGTLSFGTDASYPPAEFVATDGTTIEGFDVDLGNAIAATFGLTGEWTNVPFDSLIPRVQSDTYEVGMSAFTITTEREQVVNMVSYFQSGTSWAVATGNPTNVTPDTACGHRIAVQKATIQAKDLAARNKACTDAGQDAISIDEYIKQTDATTAVVSGKDDAMLADSVVVAYAIAQTNGQLETTGDIYDAAPYGIVVNKPATDLASAIQAAVQALIDDGTYQKILDNWLVGDGAISTSDVNPSVQ
jgi:polar amino acid transport system substrate-binding protein